MQILLEPKKLRTLKSETVPPGLFSYKATEPSEVSSVVVPKP